MTEQDIPLEPRKHRVSIEYCVPCDYSEHALRVARELITNYQHVMDEFVFKMGSKGVFEVEVDGETLFSKKALNRHPRPGEVLKALREFVGSGVRPYG